jgi:2-polyprenyl-3-methyl-5-hydroxy-6-metoxy-1,4-benzoquinol methylase
VFPFGERWIVTCPDCGLRLLVPQPSDVILEAVYSERYFLGGEEPQSRARVQRLKRLTAAHYLDTLTRVAGFATVRLLEVGCGRGELLFEAQQRGLVVRGLEFSPEAAAEANRLLGGALVSVGSGYSLVSSSELFDVVVGADVIEHLRDPCVFQAQV